MDLPLRTQSNLFPSGQEGTALGCITHISGAGYVRIDETARSVIVNDVALFSSV